MSDKANLAASIAARLLNRTKQDGTDYQAELTAYCLERFLFRLGASTCRDRFVLKGAMLLKVWSNHPYRATRDLDLLRRGAGEVEVILQDIRSILETQVPDDAVTFDGKAMKVEPIRADDHYAGLRVSFPAHFGKSRVAVQIDIGVGDAVWPAPSACVYPTLLDQPAPEVLAYPRDTVVAEKLEALVVLGGRNSRIKDFFDLHHLATNFEFDRAVLGEAVHRTFERRDTVIPDETPIGLTREYWEHPLRPAQLRAFARRAIMTVPDKPEEQFLNVLQAFLGPVLQDAKNAVRNQGRWPPGGPWE